MARTPTSSPEKTAAAERKAALDELKMKTEEVEFQVRWRKARAELNELRQAAARVRGALDKAD